MPLHNNNMHLKNENQSVELFSNSSSAFNLILLDTLKENGAGFQGVQNTFYINKMALKPIGPLRLRLILMSSCFFCNFKEKRNRKKTEKVECHVLLTIRTKPFRELFRNNLIIAP